MAHVNFRFKIANGIPGISFGDTLASTSTEIAVNTATAATETIFL